MEGDKGEHQPPGGRLPFYCRAAAGWFSVGTSMISENICTNGRAAAAAALLPVSQASWLCVVLELLLLHEADGEQQIWK